MPMTSSPALRSTDENHGSSTCLALWRQASQPDFSHARTRTNARLFTYTSRPAQVTAIASQQSRRTWPAFVRPCFPPPPCTPSSYPSDCKIYGWSLCHLPVVCCVPGHSFQTNQRLWLFCWYSRAFHVHVRGWECRQRAQCLTDLFPHLHRIFRYTVHTIPQR